MDTNRVSRDQQLANLHFRADKPKAKAEAGK